MKNLVYLLFLLLISCESTKEKDINYVLFSGTVENPVSDVVAIYGNDFEVEIQLNEQNSFSDTLFIPANGYYSFSTGRESSAMFLNQGDVIELNVEMSMFDETIRYSGKGAEKNNYLAKKYMESELNGPNFEDFFSVDEDTFTGLNNMLFTSEVDFLMASEIPDENFKEVEKKGLKYDFLSNISNYKEYHIYLTKDADFDVSPDFYAKFQGFDYDNEADYLTYASYKRIVANHYIKSIDTPEELEATFASIQTIKSEEIKNSLLFNFQYSFSPAYSDLELFYNLLMETSTDEEYKAELTEKYNMYKNLTPGNVSPEFSYPDRDGNMVSLEDLKGNYVYVDVWATWCGPCKREIPALKDLTNEFSGQDIAFVSISIDEKKDYDKWTAMLDENDMQGIQLFADNDWKSDFVKAYAIQGIPRFILIDKEGNIISADTDRPSDPNLKATLEDLL